MKSFTYLICNKQIKNSALFAIFAMLLGFTTQAQFRDYGIVYSDNIKGSSVLFGNTLMAIKLQNGNVDVTKMNNNSANGNAPTNSGNNNYGNDGNNMQFVDIDGNINDGAGTRNSSSSDVSLPAGSTVVLARLYWGGRTLKSEFDITNVNNQTIKIRKGTSGSYTEFGANQLDKTEGGSGSSAYQQYQAYANITNFISNNGQGTYTVGNAALSTGTITGGGYYGGWSIVIVYSDPSQTFFNSVRIYDGFQEVSSSLATVRNVTLTGLDVPSGTVGVTDARMGVVAWEGDANLKGDYLEINGVTYSDGKNQSNNPWNGTISTDGVHVTTKNPNYTNQMALDIDQFYVGGPTYGIEANDTQVLLTFGTEQDQYFPGLFSFVIKTKDPIILIDKTVKDANNNNIAQANEVLTYKIKGTNTGEGAGNKTVVIDTLPNTVIYVPGSIKILSSPGGIAGAKTDALNDDQADVKVVGGKTILTFRVGAGATSTLGGKIDIADMFEVEFKVTVKPVVSGTIPPIYNIARVETWSDANQKSTDDGSVLLEPQGGPLPVTLTKFTTALFSSNAKLEWMTSMEFNCKHYEIERSIDGRTFVTIGIVAGKGTTETLSTYTFTDNASAANAAIVYYRLKQVDIDGKSSYSFINSVRLTKENAAFAVSPNPFSSYLNINLDWSKNEVTTVKVFNMTGKEVVSKKVQMVKGLNYVAISELANLPSGNYVLQFNSGAERLIKKITKQ